jgi:hypothetical protein
MARLTVMVGEAYTLVGWEGMTEESWSVRAQGTA